MGQGDAHVTAEAQVFFPSVFRSFSALAHKAPALARNT